ncbi:MAG: DUF2085 domain-containing protein [Candidatus Aegiribacteria sp.]|nr:DUF2085 domain-containing protein [Candidatus Aegiribacteria sp.]
MIRKNGDYPIWALLIALAFLAIWITGMLPPVLERLSSESTAGSIRCVYKLLCHGIPDRCPQLFGRPAAVCVRCTGIYISFFIGCAIIFPILRNKLVLKTTLLTSIFFSGAMATQWIMEFKGSISVSPFLQIVTGFLWGLGLSQLLCLLIDRSRCKSNGS